MVLHVQNSLGVIDGQKKITSTKKLDRVISNTNWLEQFPRALVLKLLNFTSDYNPILLNFYGNNEPFGVRPFHFFEAWFQDSTCQPMIDSI